MPVARLSPLDASFLGVESPTAHMHVGWVAVFARPPRRRPPLTFEALRDHIEGRLHLAPRYRQKLVPVPLGLNDPVWVDDPDFDLTRHVRHVTCARLSDVIDMVMSEPLKRDRPLWELWIADRLADGRIGVVGKAHHCMVDGLAAVQLAALLLDPSPEPAPPEPDSWQAAPEPDKISLLAEGLRDLVSEELDLLRIPTRLVRSPKRLFSFADDAKRAARALAHTLAPAPLTTLFNEPISPERHLASLKRPLDDLRRIKSRFGTTINDVLLAVSSGGVRRFLQEHGQRPMRLKTMVPVSFRAAGAASELGNRISWTFIDLPCDEPDPVRRLKGINTVTSERKRAGELEGAETVVRALARAPRPLQHAVSHLVASARAFNFVVSNIPGPRQPLYMLGCELEEAYPIVPLADRHAMSIGMTTIKEGAFFGIYSDCRSLPDADLLADKIGEAVEELLAIS